MSDAWVAIIELEKIQISYKFISKQLVRTVGSLAYQLQRAVNLFKAKNGPELTRCFAFAVVSFPLCYLSCKPRVPSRQRIVTPDCSCSIMHNWGSWGGACAE